MGAFGKAIDKAKSLVGKHEDKVSKGMDQASKLAKEKTGGKYDEKIDKAGESARGRMGIGDQDQESEKPPNQGNGEHDRPADSNPRDNPRDGENR